MTHSCSERSSSENDHPRSRYRNPRAGLTNALRSAFTFSWRAMGKAALLGVLAAGAEGALALALGRFAEQVASRADIGWTVAVLATAGAVRIIVQVTIGHVAWGESIEAQRSLRRVGLDAILEADASASEPTTDALARWLDRVPRAAQARQASASIAAQSVQFIVLGVLILSVSPVLGTGMLVVVLATGAIAAAVARRVGVIARGLGASQRTVVSVLERATRHTLEIRALGTKDMERSQLAHAVDEHASLQRRVARGSALASVSPLLPGMIATAGLAAYGARSGLDAATLIATLYLVVRISGVMASAGHSLGVIAAAGSALAELYVERTVTPPLSRSRVSNKEPCCVRIDDVTLALQGKVVLANANMMVQGGEIVAIIGPSGVGKTTLLRGVLGLVEPREGRVRIDGMEASAWLATHSVGLVTAEPLLFAGTLRANLAYGAAEAPNERAMLDALARVSAEEVAAGPEGLDRRVGEGGEGLSFGERQRLALARSLMSQPSLLIVDEPTSGLEPRLEKEIASLLATLRGRCTVLIATHREALIEVCGRVLEIVPGEEGATVVERGRPPPTCARETGA